MLSLPYFPYHRDPTASGSLRESDALCECCGKSPGVLYKGVVYARSQVRDLCPWCIADGSASAKYGASFFDAYFVDDAMNEVSMPSEVHKAVFSQTIGFSTFNPIGWWVHCDQPAEYVTRHEPYEMVFECRVCHSQHTIDDLD
jgi:hypothetical protein